MSLVKNKKKSLYLFLTAVMCLSSGCHADNSLSDALSTAENQQTQEAQTQEIGSKTAVTESFFSDELDVYGAHFYMGDFIQDEGITYGYENINFAAWDGDIESGSLICQNPACTHDYLQNPECGALYPEGGEGSFAFFSIYSFLNQGKRIILWMDTETDNVSDTERLTTHTTTVYECDTDGTGRKEIAEIDGAVMASSTDVAVYNGKIYFSKLKTQTDQLTREYVEDGIPVEEYSSYNTYAFSSLDLDTYEVKEYAQIEANSYFSSVCITNTNMYFVGMDLDEENFYLYQMDPETGECSVIYESEDYFHLNGALADTVLLSYKDENTGKWNYVIYNDVTGEQNELISGATANACVVGGTYAIMTEFVSDTRDDPEKDYANAYEFYDFKGEKLGEAKYDNNITLHFSMNGKVFYSLTAYEGQSEKAGLYAADYESALEPDPGGTYIESM